MTAPLSWTTPPVSAAPPLVVRPERRKVRRLLAFILVANGVLALIALLSALWASSVAGWWGGAALAIGAAGAVFQMVFHAYFYGRMAGTPSIAEIGPEGVRGLTTRWIAQDLPWSSITSVSHSWNSLVISPVPGAGPKVLIPTRAIDTDVATIRAAVSHFSGGRL